LSAGPARRGFVTRILWSANDAAIRAFNVYLAEQTESIRRSVLHRLKNPKVQTLLPSFLLLPLLIARAEATLSDLDTTSASGPALDIYRVFLNGVVQQMFAGLDAWTLGGGSIAAGGGYGSTSSDATGGGGGGLATAVHVDFLQFIHHSLFCLTAAGASLECTRETLASRLAFSSSRRSFHENRFVQRDLFAANFPKLTAVADTATATIQKFDVTAASANGGGATPSAPIAIGSAAATSMDETAKAECEAALRGAFKPEMLAAVAADIDAPGRLSDAVKVAKQRLERRVAACVAATALGQEAFFRGALLHAYAALQQHVCAQLRLLTSTVLPVCAPGVRVRTTEGDVARVFASLKTEGA
jgi:hypothetical protein